MAPKRGSSSSSSEVNRFPSSSARYTKKIYNECAARKKILEEKSFDLVFLNKYIPVYLQTLKSWGWTEFLKSKHYVMPEVVKQFYFFGEDKIYDNKGGVVGYWDTPKMPTRILNENIVITDAIVNEVVGINISEGDTIIPRLNEAERMMFRKIVFKKENLDMFPTEVAMVSNLDVPERILHYVIGKRFFPRSRPSEITDLDLYCMARIMKGVPFNFGAFVVDKMREGCVRTRGEKSFHCPYGKLITMLCENIFGGSRWKDMEKIEDDGTDGLKDNINLMSFSFRGSTRYSPGFESLDEQIAKVLRGEVGPKRKRRPSREEAREEVREEEDEEEEVGHEENVSLETLMNTMVQGFARIDSWRDEVDVWRGTVDSRLSSMEDCLYGRRRTDGAGSSGGGNDAMEP